MHVEFTIDNTKRRTYFTFSRRLSFLHQLDAYCLFRSVDPVVLGVIVPITADNFWHREGFIIDKTLEIKRDESWGKCTV